MTDQSHLKGLANNIQTQVGEIHNRLVAAGQPDPSFGPDDKTDFDAAGVQELRSSCLDLLCELHDLLMTPLELLLEHAPTDVISRDVLDRFNFYDLIPVGETRTYAELAAATGLTLPMLRLVVRHAATKRIFCEPEPGVVGHTNVSKRLATDPSVRSHVRVATQEVFSASACTAKAIERWPHDTGNREMEKSGYFLGRGVTLGETLSTNASARDTYNSAMTAHRNDWSYAVKHIAFGYDWGALGEATVVDVAGGVGTVSRILARQYPSLKFIVQDQEAVVKDVVVEDDIRSRITFQAHDMFTPQPVRGAAVYVFRRVFMEWKDDKAVEILQNLKPGLEPGKSRVVIADPYLHEPGSVPLWQERKFRTSDFYALAQANTCPRDTEQWLELFKAAGSGFRVKSIKPLKNADMMILEALWEGE